MTWGFNKKSDAGTDLGVRLYGLFVCTIVDENNNFTVEMKLEPKPNLPITLKERVPFHPIKILFSIQGHHSFGVLELHVQYSGVKFSPTRSLFDLMRWFLVEPAEDGGDMGLKLLKLLFFLFLFLGEDKF